MLAEFKKFILKGNVIDLSTGVIIGAAFTGIVNAFTKGIIEPVLALAGGGSSPSLTVPLAKRVVEVTEKVNGQDVKRSVEKIVELDLGGLIGAVISFLITAAIVFFVIVKPVNKMLAFIRTGDAATPAPATAVPTPTEKLLAEIRDELKRRNP
jgi:large conductance mechanosensitive channel